MDQSQAKSGKTTQYRININSQWKIPRKCSCGVTKLINAQMKMPIERKMWKTYGCLVGLFLHYTNLKRY